MEVKIVFTGPPNAGKTTAIAALSDTAPIVTDVRNSDIELGKQTTTVGLDYGVVSLGEGDQVRLYGTPGQQRFDFMWRILARNALGIVILLDNSQPEAREQLAGFLRSLAPSLLYTACAIGVGRLESHPVPAIDAFEAIVAEAGYLIPVIPVDVRNRADVLLLVELLLSQAEGRTVMENA